MTGSTSESPVRDLLANMTAESLAASSLDDNTLMLVRIAALVAVDAPAVSDLPNLDAASEIGIDAEQVRGVLAAVAPIVGTARVASATGKIVDALDVEIEIAVAAAAGTTRSSRAQGAARARWVTGPLSPSSCARLGRHKVRRAVTKKIESSRPLDRIGCAAPPAPQRPDQPHRRPSRAVPAWPPHSSRPHVSWAGVDDAREARSLRSPQGQ